MSLSCFISHPCILAQDFEIAGSRTAVDEDGEGGQVAREGSSPESEGEGGARSLGGTVHSWDSHANYRHDLGDDDEGRVLFRGVIVYCDDKHIRSATGIVRILLLVSLLVTLTYSRVGMVLRISLVLKSGNFTLSVEIGSSLFLLLFLVKTIVTFLCHNVQLFFYCIS